jgi:flagellar motor switch protein FliG
MDSINDDSLEDARRFIGAQKAAAILLAMGKAPATRLLKHLEPNELREVTRAAARLGTVSVPTLESLVEDFTSAFSAGASLLGDVGHAREMVADSMSPDEVAEMLSDVSASSDDSVWDALSGSQESVLQAYLANEHPLIATYILSKLPPPLAAQIVARMARETRIEVLCAMIVRPSVPEDVQRVVEEAIRKDLSALTARAAGLDNHSRIADIINNLEPLDARDVVESLVAARPKEARMVMKMLFSFDDLPRLSQRSRATLFDKLQTETVVLALRGTEADFRDVVLSAMASRSRRLVESELSTATVASPRDIAKARKQIVELVLKMTQRGEIEIPPPDGAEAA